LIDRVNDNLGCAAGFKTVGGNPTPDPSVIMFAPHKVPAALLSPNQRIPKRLDGPDGLWCKTDVVIGRKSADEPPAPPMSAANQLVIDELRSGEIGLIGDIQLGFFESD
jgi:hypothetical protein